MNADPPNPYHDYIRPSVVNEDFLTIRDTQYPIGSISPSGEARFHAPGQIAYYIASGDRTALTEVYGSPDATLAPNHAAFKIPTGVYHLFDLCDYSADHPSESEYLLSSEGDRGWGRCQELRNTLESLNCSGVIYPSQKYSGGVNIAIWPLSRF